MAESKSTILPSLHGHSEKSTKFDPFQSIDLNGLRQPRPIVGVAAALHVPTIREETRRDVVAESQIGMPSRALDASCDLRR